MHAGAPSPPPPSGRSGWEWIFQVPRLILGQLAYVTVYGSPGVAVGSVLGYLGILCGRPLGEFPLLMLVGIAVYLPVLAYYFTPDRIYERRSRKWDRWLKEQIVTKAQHKEWKQELSKWYQEEIQNSLPRAGKLPPLASQPTPGPPSTKKARAKP